MKQNIDVADLHLNRQSWYVIQYSKFNHGKTRKRFEDIRNNYGRQVDSRTSKKNISTVWNMEQFDMGQVGCRTSLVQPFGNLKFSDMQSVGRVTWAHINGHIDACKCTEIFIQQFLKVENQNN